MSPHPLLRFIDTCSVVLDNFSIIIVRIQLIGESLSSSCFLASYSPTPLVDVYNELLTDGKPTLKADSKKDHDARICTFDLARNRTDMLGRFRRQKILIN